VTVVDLTLAAVRQFLRELEVTRGHAYGFGPTVRLEPETDRVLVNVYDPARRECVDYEVVERDDARPVSAVSGDIVQALARRAPEAPRPRSFAELRGLHRDEAAAE
jgi:hypothetical protein